MSNHPKLIINNVELSVYQSRRFQEFMTNSKHFQRRFGEITSELGRVEIKKKR